MNYKINGRKVNCTVVFHYSTKNMSFLHQANYKLVKSKKKNLKISEKPKPKTRRNPKPFKDELCFDGPIDIQYCGGQRIPWHNDDAEGAMKERRCN